MAAGDNADINLSWEDQNKINTFSKLNSKILLLEQQYEAKKLEKEYLDDVSSELELCDDEDLLKYKIGNTFVNAPYSQVQEWLQNDQKVMDEQFNKLKNQIDLITEEMNTLKSNLYSRFGTSINLERD